MTEVPEDRVRDLERGADEMEEGLGRLESDLETAHARADENRERANPEAAAGDWEDESAGAQQGDDPQDAAGAEGPGERDEEGGAGAGGAVADAPVHEAEQVAPGEETGEPDGDEQDGETGEPRRDEQDGEGGGAVADASVHEAERVEPED